MKKWGIFFLFMLIIWIFSTGQATHIFKPQKYYYTYDEKHEPVLKMKYPIFGRGDGVSFAFVTPSRPIDISGWPASRPRSSYDARERAVRACLKNESP